MGKTFYNVSPKFLKNFSSTYTTPLKSLVWSSLGRETSVDLSWLDKSMDMYSSSKKLLTTPIGELPSIIRDYENGYTRRLPPWVSLYQAIEDALNYPYTFGKVIYLSYSNIITGILLYTITPFYKLHQLADAGVTNIGYIPFENTFSNPSHIDAPINIANILKEPFKEIRKTFKTVDWQVDKKSSAVLAYQALIHYLTNTNPDTLNVDDFMSSASPSYSYYQFHLPQFNV